MIGLEKGTVQVIPHYASWRYAFEQKRRVLQEHIGDHVHEYRGYEGHRCRRGGVAVVPRRGRDSSPRANKSITIGLPSEE